MSEAGSSLAPSACQGAGLDPRHAQELTLLRARQEVRPNKDQEKGKSMSSIDLAAEPNTLAPSMFPYPNRPALPQDEAASVRPFGLLRAVPIANEKRVLPALVLCPQRQISVTAHGTPFISEPSLKTEFESTTETVEDSQIATDREMDTDA